MSVLIEASEVYRNRTGIGKFSQALLAHMPSETELDFSPSDYATRTHDIGERTFSTRILNFADHLRLTQWDVARVAGQSKPDVIHSLSFFSPLLVRDTPIVNTVFDLAYFDLPDLTDRFWGAYGRRTMQHFTRRASASITISQTSKAAIIERFGVHPERVHLVYPGVDKQFKPVTDEMRLMQVREKYGLREPFVLYVGAWRKHKNVETLIEAMSGIQDASLVLTGSPQTRAQNSIPALIEAKGVSVVYTGYMPDADLPALYSLATMMVFPSLYEGFGLPIIEAMACGTPVVASDILIFREIGGQAAALFPPRDADALRATIQRLLESQDERERMSQLGVANAARFDWNRAAQAVVQIWESVR